MITEAMDYGWKSLRLAAGNGVELVLVPDVGGRLMGIRLDGHELLWVNPSLAGRLATPAELASPGELGFPLWGGEKTWVAPQSTWPHAVPMPDLDSAPYAVAATGNAVTMTSPVDRQTGLQIERVITVDGKGWTTRHILRNRGDKPRTGGPWTVMMINRDTVFFVPSPSDAIVRMLNSPDHLIETRGTLTRIECTDTTRFKTGHPLSEGWFAAFLPLAGGKAAMIAHTLSTSPAPGTWAHGHAAEVYNADQYPYCEMELHGPCVELAPGAEIVWEMHSVVAAVPAVPQTEEEVRALVGG